MKRMMELIAVLAACAAALVCWRGEEKLRSWHEGMSMASSQETWLREMNGEKGAWVVPSFNGEARVVKPPMVVWLNLLAWGGLHVPDREITTLLENPQRVVAPETEASTAKWRVTQEMMLSRARLVSAGLGLLAVAGVWVIGRVMVSDACGVLSALVMGSFIVGFQKYARMNTYDIALLGFSTMAIAGGVWAGRGDRSQDPGARRKREVLKEQAEDTALLAKPRASRGTVDHRNSEHGSSSEGGGWTRVIVGWGMCAVMGACAYMSKGPLSILIVVMGVLPAVVLMGGRNVGSTALSQSRGEPWYRKRLVHLLGLAIACGVMWGSGKWWYSLAAERVPRLAETMANEYDGPEWDVRPWWWYLTRVSLVMPWVVMAVGAVGVLALQKHKTQNTKQKEGEEVRQEGRSQHPGVRSQEEEQETEVRGQRSAVRQEEERDWRGRIAMWVWTFGLLIIFSCVGAKVERYVLPVLPGLAVLVADAWLRCARDRRGGAGWWVCVAQWGICACGTAGLAVWVSGQEWFASHGWIEKVVVRNPGIWVVICSAAALVVCCVASWRMLARGRGFGSGVMLGLWGICAGVLYAGATSGMGGDWERVQSDAMEVRAIVNAESGSGGARLLVRSVDDVLEPEFVFYAAEVFEKIGVKELKEAAKGEGKVDIVIATKNEKNEELMRGLGYEAVREVRDDSRKVRKVWRMKK